MDKVLDTWGMSQCIAKIWTVWYWRGFEQWLWERGRQERMSQVPGLHSRTKHSMGSWEQSSLFHNHHSLKKKRKVWRIMWPLTSTSANGGSSWEYFSWWETAMHKPLSSIPVTTSGPISVVGRIKPCREKIEPVDANLPTPGLLCSVFRALDKALGKQCIGQRLSQGFGETVRRAEAIGSLFGDADLSCRPTQGITSIEDSRVLGIWDTGVSLHRSYMTAHSGKPLTSSLKDVVYKFGQLFIWSGQGIAGSIRQAAPVWTLRWVSFCLYLPSVLMALGRGSK